MFKSSSDAAWQVPVCLLLILFGLTLYNRSETAQPAPETVEILVAVRDLPVGTVLTKNDLPNLVARKAVVKDSLPPRFVTEETDVIGKRLTRPLKHDEPFDPANLYRSAGHPHPPPKDIASVDFDPSAVDGVTPGARVQIITAIPIQDQTHPTVLAEDTHVLAVNEKPGGAVTVLFAVDATEARLLDLAKSRGLSLKLRKQSPNRNSEVGEPQYKAIIRLLEKLPETVTVPVAAEDLPVGITFKKDDLSKLVGRKKVPVDRLPPHIIRDEAILIGKRLSRPFRKDEAFDLAVLTQEFLSVPPGLQSASLKMPSIDRGNNSIYTGSRVRILAVVQRGEQLDVFTLVEDVLVLASEIDCEAVEMQDGTRTWKYSDVSNLTLAVDETQALLLTLAQQHGCRLKFLRHYKPPTLTKDDHAKRIAYFQDARAENRREVAPAPRVTLTLPEGLDLMSLPLPEGSTAAQFVAPGSRVDVIATLSRGEKVEAFPLLDDALVLAVDTVLVSSSDGKLKHTISLAVDRDQALLLVLAQERGCRVDVLLRSPDKPATTTKDDYKQRLKFVQELPEVAPAPRAKGE